MAEILTKSIRVIPRYGAGSNDNISPDPYTTRNNNDAFVPFSELRIDIYDAGKNKRIIKVPTGAGWLTQEWVERTYKKSDLNDIGIDIDNDDDIIFLYLTSLINTGLGNTSPLLRDLPCFAEVDTFYYNNKPVLDIDKRFINFFRDKIHPITKDFTVNSKSYNVLPFWEIVEDPWTNNYDPQNITRDFGDVIGRYKLNNNTEVVIKWRSPNSNQVYTTSNSIVYGKDYSDNWGREIIDRTDPSGDPILTNPEKAPETPWLFERTIIMRPPSDTPDSKPFTMKKDGTFAIQEDVNYGEEKIWQLSSTDADRGFKILQTRDGVLEPDIAILQEVIEFWKRVPGNESLDICYNLVNDTKVYLTLYDGYKKPFIDYISPIISSSGASGASGTSASVGASGASGASGPSASGASQSDMTDLYEPKELIFNVEKEGYLINVDYGEFKLVPEEELFVFGGYEFDDSDLLKEELEREFAGDEAALEEFEEQDLVGPNEEAYNQGKEQGKEESGESGQSSSSVVAGEIYKAYLELVNSTTKKSKGQTYQYYYKEGQKKLAKRLHGTIKSTSTIADGLKMIIENFEGGYYHPIQAYSTTPKSDKTGSKGVEGRLDGYEIMDNSGETLFGLDRVAGAWETGRYKVLGTKFWSKVDELSGWGFLKADNKSKRTKAWASIVKSKNLAKYKTGKREQKPRWGHSYVPKGNDHKVLFDLCVEMITQSFQDSLKKRFGDHPVHDIVLNDGRLLFLFLRATWNGSGFYQNYANFVKKKYDEGFRDPNQLIAWDLYNRFDTKSGNFKKGVVPLDDAMDWNRSV